MNQYQHSVLGKKYASLNETQNLSLAENNPAFISQNPENNPTISPSNPSNDQNFKKPSFLERMEAYIKSKQNARREAMLAPLNMYNSSKLGVRFSTERFPGTKRVYKGSHVPFTAMIQPFASIYSPEEFPVANFGPTNPIVRCEMCRGYVNPFTEFIDKGHNFLCNFCGFTNKVPEFYFCQLDEKGERIDKHKRTELHCGAYDIKAGTDYMERPPMPPTYFFVLDVSEQGIKNGSIALFIDKLNDIISNELLPGDTRTMIGFLAYDTNVHLIDLNPTYKQPRLITLTEFDGELPINQNLVVNLYDQKESIQLWLKSILNIFGSTKDKGSNFTTAMRVAARVLRPYGGRVYVIQSNSNIIHEKPLALPSSVNNIDKKLFLAPTSPIFSEISQEMQKAFITVDLFIFSEQYKNVITLGDLVRYLNGDIHYYQDCPERSQKFYFEFKNSLLREYTWESVFRIRHSGGWKVNAIYGNYSVRLAGNLLGVPNMDDTKSFIYEFELEDEIYRFDIFYIQTALLYTTSNGERRIRVLNYGIPCVETIEEIHAHIDPQVLGCSILRQGLQKLYQGALLAEVRNFILSKTRLIYNEVCPKLPKTQVKSPESMVTFSLLMLGILKHSLFIDNPKENNWDVKNALRLKLNMLNVEETCQVFVPYLFAVHNLTEGDFATYTESEEFIFPPLLSLSTSSLQSDGIFLMDDACSLYLLVGSKVDPGILKSLFGINDLNEVEVLNEDMMYSNPEDPLVTRVHNLISELRSRKADQYTHLYIVKEGQQLPAEWEFFVRLIEDKLNIPGSYNVSFYEFVESLSQPSMHKV